MPKKSRKQKMRADQRRVTAPTLPTAVSFQLADTKPTVPVLAKPQEDHTQLTAIKQDLTRTLILAVGAIAIELALYQFGKGMF